MNATERAEIVGDKIDAILAHLDTEGIPHSLDDTGGGCVCVRVDLGDGAWIWISDDEGSLVTCRYEDANDDTGECLTYGGTLDDMTRVIREHLPATQPTNTVINEAPAGYTLPAALARLIDLCEANEWKWLAQWRKDIEGVPYVEVVMGDGDTSVRLSWHNRDRAPGRLGLFSKLWRRDGETSSDGRIIRQGWNWTRCPSLKAVEAAITE